MNMFWREIKAQRKSLLIWCIGMIFLLIAGMSKYATLSVPGESQALNELMADMPKSLQAIFGVGSLDLSTVSGYYGVLFLYIAIMATIHAAMLGATMIAKEERDKTAEFLLVKPITRNQMLTAKLAAALVGVVILNAATLVTSLIVVQGYSDGESISKDILLLISGLLILQLLFMLLGSAVASLLKLPKRAAGLTSGMLLLAFFVSVVIDISGNLEGLKVLTPFKYFDAKSVLEAGSLSAGYMLLSLALMVLALVGTYVGYNKRDLKV
ncbi:ABC transporter permease subunit [Paenibacillus sp. 1001270B_150601_E10]|uniref:ABC transporter permease subunit n=1 Tax=Paenibacillus sp. 1001270B_150601_E10 TaxID=2787079 RepID=UPI00189D3D8A|nr:ABC transporter permease subunit [Paenibacillus sp. 1001270B_150601_E10]